MEITLDTLRELFGHPGPPLRVTESQVDGFDRKLKELAKKQWEDISTKDLWYYLHDLCYMKLQPDHFAYLFPVCLHFWYQTLMQDDSACPGGVEDVHCSIRRGNILTKMLDEQGREKVYTVIHDGFLHRLDHEEWPTQKEFYPTFTWLYRFNSMGITFPIINRIWESWWSLETRGRTICALHWASGLIYDDTENPLFYDMSFPYPPKKFPEEFLRPNWRESDAFFTDVAWLRDNLDFLRRTLSPDYLHQKMTDAAKVLASGQEQDMALELATLAKQRAPIIQQRIDCLLISLAIPEYP